MAEIVPLVEEDHMLALVKALDKFLPVNKEWSRYRMEFVTRTVGQSVREIVQTTLVEVAYDGDKVGNGGVRGLHGSDAGSAAGGSPVDEADRSTLPGEGS